MAGINPALVKIQEEPKPETIAIFDEPQLRLPESIVQQRAEKIAFATNGRIKTDEVIRAHAVGNEGELRRAEASRQQAQLLKQKQALTMDVLKTHEGPVTPEIAGLLEATHLPSPVEPMDVFEKTYADTLLHTVLAQDDEYDKVFDEALKYDPDKTMAAVDEASWMIQRKEIIQKTLEDLEARKAQQGFGEKAWEIVEGFIPGYSWSSQSRAVEEANADAFFQGANVRQQRDYLLLQPPEKFAAEFTRVVNELAESNVNEAIQFAQSMGVYSTSDQAFGNLNSILDLVDAATVVPLTKVASGAVKVGKAARRAANRKEPIFTPQEVHEAQKEVRTQLRGTFKGKGNIKFLSKHDPEFNPPANDDSVITDFHDHNTDRYLVKDGENHTRTVNTYKSPLPLINDTRATFKEIFDTLPKDFVDPEWPDGFSKEDMYEHFNEYVEEYFANNPELDVDDIILYVQNAFPTNYTGASKQTDIINRFEKKLQRYVEKSEVIANLPKYETGKKTIVDGFHGTTAVFDKFDKSKRGLTTGAPSAMKGTFFSRNPHTANEYAQYGVGFDKWNNELVDIDSKGVKPNVIPARIKFNNPYVYDFKGQTYREESYRNIMDKAEAEGHDGVILLNTRDGGPTDVIYAVFDDKNIAFKYDNAAIKARERNTSSVRTITGGVTADTVSANDNALPSARFANQLRGAVRGTGGRITRPADVAAEVGRLDQASVFEIIDRFRKADPNNRGLNIQRNLPSILDTQGIARGASRFTTGQVNDIMETINKQAGEAMEATTDGLLISRLPDEAKAVAISEAQRQLRNRLDVSAQRAILDISVEPTTDAAGVTSVHYALGTANKNLFQDRSQANMVANQWYKLPSSSYTIKELGSGYYIDAFKPIDETDPNVRNHMISLENTTPTSASNLIPWLTSARTPEEILAPFQRENRHTAVHGISRLLSLTKNMGEQIGKLSARQKSDLNEIMDEASGIEWIDNPGTPDEKTRRGIEYHNLGELEGAYLKRLSRPPTPQEAKAYFSAVQLGDLDYFLRNLDLYKAKTRQGIENIQIFLPDDKGGKFSFKFEGVIKDDLPNTEEDYGVLLYNQESLDKSYFRGKNVTPQGKEELNRLIREEGYRIVQVAQPDAKPMKGLLDVQDIVNYVLVKNIKSDQIDWQQIPRRPGGHVIYPAEHYIKQAKVRKTGHGTHSYEGDITAMGFETEVEAIKYTAAWERARQLLDDDAALQTHLRGTLPFNVEEFKILFKDEIDEETGEVLKEAKFDKTIPFRYLGARQGTNDKYKDALNDQFSNLEDTIDSQHNLYRDIDKEFTGERNLALWTVEEGTEANPVVKLGKARKLDSLSTINKATSGMVRSRYMNDYKISAIESFIQEFSDLMDTGIEGIKAVRSNPMRWLHEPRWKNTPEKERIQQAKAARNAILNLLGTPDEVTSATQRIFGKLANQVYKVDGQKASNWTNEHLIPTMVDPFQYTRALAFHSKLGLFNPTQFFLQYQTLTHIIGVAGVKHAYTATTAAWSMRRLMLNDRPQMVDFMGRFANKVGGWKPEELKESFEALKRSGLWYVEGDVAWLDQVTPPSMVGNRIPGLSKTAHYGKKALDTGTFFFKEAERMIRLTAWNAAYKEWREANPSAVLNDKAIQSILRRQNTLSVNMTRASNASWQKGAMSVPTQFMAYQARLMEQFLGKQLTIQEKMNALMWYSIMYGVPTASAASIGIWPIYESIKQGLMEKGYTDTKGDFNNQALETIVDGIMPMAVNTLLSTATGKNVDLNISERYGPGGLSIFKEVANGESGVADLLLGASGSILKDFVVSANPIMEGVFNVFSNDEDAYPIIAEDYIDAARNISTINNVAAAVYAWNYGVHMSKNRSIIANEINGPSAVMMAITGLSPQEISDTFIMAGATKHLTSVQRDAQRVISKYLRLGIEAAESGKELDAEKYFKAARHHVVGAGFRPDQYGQLFSEAMNGYGDVATQVRQDFFLNKAPAEDQDTRFNTYIQDEE